MPTTTQGPSATPVPRVTLYYRQGKSDKVYHAFIEPSGGGFLVNFAFGRRGSTLQTGTKTPTPVDQATAQKLFDKLVAEKMAKGYSPGEEGTPYQQTSHEQRSTGIVPQLLNAIDEHQAEKLLADSDFWAQEKLDGMRVLIQRSDQQVQGINRRGLVIALPQNIADRALQIGGQQWLMDGEAVGEVFHAFDLLESAGNDLRHEPYAQRLKALCAFVGLDGAIRITATARTTSEKRAMLGRLRQEHREGIVFKKHQAPYTPGRPASGGDHLKCKFTATASCLVAGTSKGRRSVRLVLTHQHRDVPVGSVTIPPNQEIPRAGQVVEIRYLYAREGGSLYQPVYLGVRDDIAAEACTLEQLKLKAGEAEAEG